MTDPASTSAPPARERRRWDAPALVRLRPGDARIGATAVAQEGAFAQGS